MLAMLCFTAGLPSLAAVSELKDDAGKTIIKYVVETPERMRCPSVKDPARQLGLILCSPNTTAPPAMRFCQCVRRSSVLA